MLSYLQYFVYLCISVVITYIVYAYSVASLGQSKFESNFDQTSGQFDCW